MEETSETPTPNNETETPSSIFTQEWFLTEILCRLPAKPLFRSKCLSKQCLALISDPSFVRTYISRASSSSKPRPWTLVATFMNVHPYNEERFDFERNLDSSLLVNNYESPTISSRCVTPMKLSAVTISNGLLLCRWELKSYVILNPITKQFIILPEPHWLRVGTLAFHAHVDREVGAVSYKVARLRMVWGDDPTNGQIIEELSSETNKWTSGFVDFPEPILPCDYSFSFSFKEILHWVDDNSNNGSGCIISYDPIRIIRTSGRGRIIWCGEIVSAGGEQTIRCIKSDKEGLICVWRMKDYKEGTWDLEHQFATREILLPSVDNRMMPCSCLDNITSHPAKPEIFYFWAQAEGDEEWMLVTFNVRSREVRVNDDTIPRVRGLEDIRRMFYLDYPFVPPLWPAILHQPSRSEADIQPASSSSGWDKWD